MKIVIVDIFPAVRKRLRNIIEEYIGFNVCGEAEELKSAIKIIADTDADIAIVDIDQGYINGTQLIYIIKGLFPDIKILAISMNDKSIEADNVIQAGAGGYISKLAVGDNILFAIEAVSYGKIYRGCQVIDKMEMNNVYDS